MGVARANTPKHLQWLSDTGKRLKTPDGVTVEVWELEWKKASTRILAEWAQHFRSHYCLDSQLDQLRQGTGLSRKDFLLQIKFPTSSKAPGPSIRAGDFAEVLLLDFVEFVLGYWTPRTRFSAKTIRNESTKGCDIIGFSFHQKKSQLDELIVFESKARFSKTLAIALNDAVKAARKDPLRLPESLNAIKQRLLDLGDRQSAGKVGRFQDKVSKPFIETFGAAGISNVEPLPSAVELPKAKGLRLVLIGGSDLMTLVNTLYELAAENA